MLKVVKKIVGVVVTWLKFTKKDLNTTTMLPSTHVELKLKDIEPNMTSDSFSTTEHNEEIGQRVSQFMKTPEAKRIRSEMTIQAVEDMMIKIVEKLQSEDHPLHTKMLLSLALHESAQAMQTHQAKILTMQ